MKKLLLGDEAIAQGAIDAGLSGVYAYPGTPSTEITEYIQGYCKKNPDEKIHNRWCTNERLPWRLLWACLLLENEHWYV